MASPIEQIKERVTIVDVVSSYVKLQKAGKNYRALSPFKKEKTPSFFVSPERNMYHCFSSGKGGDIFTFVQEMEGVDFAGALRILAKRAGVTLKREDPKTRSEEARLYGALDAASSFFEETREGTKEAQEYLSSRGITDTSVRKWRIGFAPSLWDGLYKHLIAKGFSERELDLVGLIKKHEERQSAYYDRFRSRIMFPLFDSIGRIVAFSGRSFTLKGESSRGDVAKYLNSPETALFKKSKLLYGYDKAKVAIRRYNFSILVEGQFDVVLSHQVGFTNAVAVSGTALSEDHLHLLMRLSPNVVMAFDADSAGIASAGKSAETALSLGMDVKVAVLPEGVDPADAIVKNPDLWRQAVRTSRHVIDFYLDVLDAREKDRRVFKQKVSSIVLPFVAKIENRIDQAHFVKRIADRLSMREEPIWYELSRIEKQSRVLHHSSPDRALREVDVHKEVEPEVFSRRREALLTRLIGILFLFETRGISVDTRSSLEQSIESIVGKEALAQACDVTQETRNKLCFEIELSYGEEGPTDSHVSELLKDLEVEYIKETFGRLMGEIKSLEEAGEIREVKERMMQCKELADRLTTLAALPLKTAGAVE